MTTQPFDTEAYWLARERNAEWDCWTCADCGATCVGDPAEHWCGEAS